MIISIWRYSHLTLAVSSFLFILIAALTGIVLAFEPISQEVNAYPQPVALSEVSTAVAIAKVKDSYEEVFSIAVDKNERVSASVLTAEGDMQEFYVNPLTGEKVAALTQESAIFNFARALHRSLFLKSIGRFFVALTSFLLFLISVSGLVLVLKRQQGFKKFFSKIVKENFFQYGHVFLGRLFLLPIIVITLTGVYLSLFHFDVIPHPKLSHEVNLNQITETPKLPITDFPIFKNTPLSEVTAIDFPFSTDVTDYYQLHLKNKEVLVNQYTGDILSELYYPFSEIAFTWSWNLHTGEGNAIWSFILLLAAISILFFIYSGFKITLKRKKATIKNKYKQADCPYVILVGSETGSSIAFAAWFQKQLQLAGKKAYLTQMNQFSYTENVEHLVVFTATYGKGEAPTNATKFNDYFQSIKTNKPFSYSVVGFGSFAYPDFCKFAYEVEEVIENNPNSRCLLHLHTINNRSVEAFNQWVKQWSQVSEIGLPMLEGAISTTKRKKKKTYEVVSKTAIVPAHNTFLIELKPLQKKHFQSGDLLALAPEAKQHDRLYSVGITSKNTLLLSIKLHEKGLCSTYLNELTIGAKIKASRLKNKAFYFPKKAPNVIMIATGTGIAPFLGMLQHNSRKKPIDLFWGARDEIGFRPYKTIVESALENGQLRHFIPAYSRADQEKVYVQDRLKEREDFVIETLEKGGVLMICGSVGMQKDVLKVLNEICLKKAKKTLSEYQKRNQLLMDCY